MGFDDELSGAELVIASGIARCSHVFAFCLKPTGLHLDSFLDISALALRSCSF